MTKIIEFIIAVVLVFVVFGILSKLYKRINLVFRMKRLAGLDGVEIKRLTNPIKSLFSLSKSPDYIVKIYDNVYLVRTYNGGNISKVVHFASERFTVRFSRLNPVTYSAPRSRGRIFSVRGFSLGGRVIVLPNLSSPPELLGREYTEVIVFNPAPGEVSYVVEEKTSIKVAFTGDKIYGRKIFTASTFEIFVDREARRIKDERLGNYYNPWGSGYKY